MTTEQALSTLGLKSGASAKRVRKAYRRKAMMSHPDKGGTDEQFNLVKNAYDYLREHGIMQKQPSFTRMDAAMAGFSMNIRYVARA